MIAELRMPEGKRGVDLAVLRLIGRIRNTIRSRRNRCKSNQKLLTEFAFVPTPELGDPTLTFATQALDGFDAGAFQGDQVKPLGYIAVIAASSGVSVLPA